MKRRGMHGAWAPMIVTASLGLSGLILGCEEEGSLEEAGEEMGEAADETADEMDDAVDEAGDELDDIDDDLDNDPGGGG